MNIRQEIHHVKNLLAQGGDLMLLRLRLLGLDAAGQLAATLKIAAMIAFAAVLALIALIALLFGLNTVLSHEAKIWVFFGIAAAAFLAVVVLLLCIPALWRNSSGMMAQTLQAMQEDWRLLNGRAQENKHDQQP